jgi:hypothetical protein
MSEPNNTAIILEYARALEELTADVVKQFSYGLPLSQSEGTQDNTQDSQSQRDPRDSKR